MSRLENLDKSIQESSLKELIKQIENSYITSDIKERRRPWIPVSLKRADLSPDRSHHTVMRANNVNDIIEKQKKKLLYKSQLRSPLKKYS